MQKLEQKKIDEWLRDNAINDPKKKGYKASTPNELGIKSGIKSTSITQDVDGSIFAVSYHCSPHKFFSFMIPDDKYEIFYNFHREFDYTRTPKKKVVDTTALDGLFKNEPKKPDIGLGRSKPW